MKMRAFWNDNGRGVASDSAREVDLEEAARIWSDEVRGVEGNFFGLIDEHGNTIQFYFDAGIADHIDYASHLAIVLMDFPRPEKNGSCNSVLTIGEVHEQIEKAFQVGADCRHFGELDFESW
jgi:hypothetical protein